LRWCYKEKEGNNTLLYGGVAKKKAMAIAIVTFFCGGAIEKKKVTAVVVVALFCGGVVKKKATTIDAVAFFSPSSMVVFYV
jgi:hypothetical protein